MATAQNVLDIEASQIGVSGTDNTYNTWIWGQHVYDPDVYPWCAAFQSWCLASAGVGVAPSASASGVFNQYDKVADADVQPGDLVVFNWDGRDDTSWCDHIGMVEWFDHSTGYFGTIEGNTGGGEGCVRRCTRYNYGSYFTAFARPGYAAESGGGAAPGTTDKLDLWYAAHTAEDGWLPRVHGLEDFAGIYGHSIDAIAIWANDGHSIDYQVHHIGGDWGTNVNSANANTDDYEAGYAGTFDCFIDLIRCYAHNDCQSGERAQYRVHILDGDWLDWQFDYETCDGQDGFAGIEGRMVDGFQIC